jgi:hypothetical protein
MADRNKSIVPEIPKPEIIIAEPEQVAENISPQTEEGY